jgi:preprotein translocase subunit SecG
LGQQMMGVQQSTDTVEKGTWILATLMALLCIATVALKPSNGGKDKAIRSIDAIKGAKIAAPAAPAAPAPSIAAPAPAPDAAQQGTTEQSNTPSPASTAQQPSSTTQQPTPNPAK